MYKKWIVPCDNTTADMILFFKRFCTRLDAIISEIGAEKLGEKHDFSKSCSNASHLSEINAPSWILNFHQFPNLLNNPSSSWATSTYGARDTFHGFYAFRFAGIEYCFVYNNSTSTSSNYYQQRHITVCVNYAKTGVNLGNSYYKYTLSYRSSTSAEYDKNGLFNPTVNTFIQVEYYKTGNINFLQFIHSAYLQSSEYHINGRFLHCGTFKISDTYKLHFPVGYMSGGDSVTTPGNKVMMQTDSEGLFRLINPQLGDVINSKYLIGRIHFGVGTSGILGTIPDCAVVNNYAYPIDTQFFIEGNLYKRLRIPTVFNENVGSSFSTYGMLLNMAFHKMEV